MWNKAAKPSTLFDEQVLRFFFIIKPALEETAEWVISNLSEKSPFCFCVISSAQPILMAAHLLVLP